MSDDDDKGFGEFVEEGNIAVDVSMLDCNNADKKRERDELSDLVAQFLASGGSINYIEPNVLADPPKKPSSNYGSQPI